ncbi:hypothetical protein CABS01_16541 [Colletotrichum abscissum]|uniref:uncharacterized protein n=1 Tax=Colletotrichum abscissum TaxID=1671311 RepID=UPI0027D7010A|nr:uncharacterized protein CABS01_16541 [Colletotrichum abscissum]KAK1521565.1 hypothetical protein CABS01_16541 [Colletotrichum abscissum]
MSNSLFGINQINKELLFTIDDEGLLHQIYGKFPQEIDRLKRAYSISDKHITHPSKPSPSQILFGTQYEEVNRTLVSVLSLRWIYRDQYEVFTRTQPSPVVLTRPSFDWVRAVFMKRLECPEDLYALLVYIVINDLGKDPQLATDYLFKTGEDISSLNHDIILLKAVKAGLVPSVDSLSQRHKEEIIRGIQLGAEFNPGQLAQSENATACLFSLVRMRGREEEFRFHFMQQLLDISGAAGHEDWTCAKKLIQPIAEAYRNVYEVAMGIISDDQGLREAYDVILVRRCEMLHRNGFRSLHVTQPEDRAMMRLLCMGGVSDAVLAGVYWSAWEMLDHRTKGNLVHSLNVDGSVAEPAIQPTYYPAMLAQGLRGAAELSREEQVRRLQSMLRYLSRVMASTEGQDGQAVVIERSVLWVVKDTVQSQAFQDDPTVLDRTAVPRSAIAVPALRREISPPTFP